jgi:hypothetical protein
VRRGVNLGGEGGEGTVQGSMKDMKRIWRGFEQHVQQLPRRAVDGPASRIERQAMPLPMADGEVGFRGCGVRG